MKTKLSKADQTAIINLQKEVLNKIGDTERNKGCSQDSDRFCFDHRLVPLEYRKQIRKRAEKILQKYNFTLPGAANEMVSYDSDGLIGFININLPARLKSEKDREDYKQYLRLKKKFEKV